MGGGLSYIAHRAVLYNTAYVCLLCSILSLSTTPAPVHCTCTRTAAYNIENKPLCCIMIMPMLNNAIRNTGTGYRCDRAERLIVTLAVVEVQTVYLVSSVALAQLRALCMKLLGK
jgi:hypothetical protein